MFKVAHPRPGVFAISRFIRLSRDARIKTFVKLRELRELRVIAVHRTGVVTRARPGDPVSRIEIHLCIIIIHYVPRNYAGRGRRPRFVFRISHGCSHG